MTTRMYAIVDLAQSRVISSVEETSSESSLPDPPVPDGHELVALTEEDLGEQSFQEFISSHNPVCTGATPVFDSWEAKHSGLSMTISAAPKNDGSNTPFISLKNGLPNSPFMVGSSTGVALNSQATGVLDDTGDGSFRVKVTDGSITSGSVTVHPAGHQDFVPVTFNFEVEAWDF